MHRVVGGIAPLAPGYSEVLIAPQPGGGLTEAETALETPHGRVAVSWTLSGDQFTVDVDVPEGVTGVLRLPGQDDRALGAGHISTSVTLPEPVGAGR
jgi:alpha-L-rhamnosidase